MGLVKSIRLFIILSILAVSGCSSFSSGPEKATIKFSAGTNINPDEDQRSSPLVINVLFLADSRQFEREDFINLFDNPGSRLGADLIKKIRIKELIPGEKRTEVFDLTEPVKYIGLVAEFSQYHRAKTLMLIPIDDGSNEFSVSIDELKLTSPNEYKRKDD